MFACGFGIVEGAQRIPAGMEFGVGNIRRFACHMTRNDPVCLTILPEIGEPARNDPLLVPPGAAIDQHFRIARHLLDQFGRLFEILGTPEGLKADEEQGRVLCPGLVDGCNQRIDILRARNQTCPGLVKRLCLTERGKPLCLARPLAVEQIVHARAMVGRRQQAGKFRYHPVFGRDIQRIAAPEVADEAGGPGLVAAGEMGACQKHRAFGRLGRSVAEGGEHGGGRWVFAEERLFRIRPEGFEPRPALKLPLGARNLGRRHVAEPRH